MLKNARGNGTKERIFMEEKIISAGVSTAETSGGANAKASVIPNANAEGSVIPNAKREGSHTASSRPEREGDPSSASPPRDDGKAVCGDTSSAPSGHLPLKGKASERVQREGDPSSAAPPRDDRGCADGSGADGSGAGSGSRGDGGRGLAVTFAARSARLADEAEALYAEWTAGAEELKKDYPAFDLAAAAKEPAFGRLLRAGVGLRTAYEATHMPQVREAIRVSAAAEAEARALDGVRLRGLRPNENGARPGGAVLTGGMAGLTREQRARIADKAMRGLL